MLCILFTSCGTYEGQGKKWTRHTDTTDKFLILHQMQFQSVPSFPKKKKIE